MAVPSRGSCLCLACLCLLVLTAAAPVHAQNLEQGLDRLAAELTQGLQPGQVRRVAVLDPEGPEKHLTAFSLFLVEELNQRLARRQVLVPVKATSQAQGRGYLDRMMRLFKGQGEEPPLRRRERLFQAVVERRKLYQVIVQQRMELSTHFDRKTVTPLGRKMGVDGLVFTTVRDLGASLEIHSRLVAVETGAILTAGRVEVAKGRRVKELLSQRPTARVRVRVAPRGVAAEVSLGGSTLPVRDGCAVFSRVPQGMCTLVVSAPCHEDYTLHFYLAGDRELKVELEPLRTSLYLVVRPPRAKVVIDGRLPLELDATGAGSLELPAGVHTITVTAPGKPLFTRRVSLCDTALTVPVDLDRGKVELTVRVHPPQAHATLDGRPIALDAQGRWQGRVQPGPHTLAARAPHHRPGAVTLNLEGPRRAELRLEPLTYPLTLQVDPPDARLLLDGKPLVLQEGRVRLEVPAGRHRLEASAPCHQSLRTELEVAGPTRRELRLVPRPLQVDFSVVYEAPDGRVRTLEPGGVLTSDDNYAVSFRTSGPAYVYIFQVDSSGQVFRLFPNPNYSPEQNPVRPGLTHWVPPQDRWMFLDQNVGQERIYLVFSCRPDRELEDLHLRLQNAVGQAAKDTAGKLIAAIKTRGPAPMTRPGHRRKVKLGKRVFEVVEKTLEAAAAGQGVYFLSFQHR